MSKPATVTVSVTRRYDVAPETVFDAFLNPSVARHFLFATASGQMVACEIDPEIGGRFKLTERRPEMGDVEHVGEYLEIDRPRRLSFTFGVPAFSEVMTTVEIEIAPLAGGGCELTLTNSGVLADYRERNIEGWSRILAGLVPAYDGRHGVGFS